MQFGQNRSVLPARRGTSVSTGVAAGGGHLVPPAKAPTGWLVYVHCPACSSGGCSVFEVTAQVFGMFVSFTQWLGPCFSVKTQMHLFLNLVLAQLETSFRLIKPSSKSIKEIAVISPLGLRLAVYQ